MVCRQVRSQALGILDGAISAITTVMPEGEIAKSCLANSLDRCTQPR
jgi:hypothetical protein